MERDGVRCSREAAGPRYDLAVTDPLSRPDDTRPPFWSYFLTPFAVLLGAAAIIVTIVVTDDEPAPSAQTAPALEALSAAAESLSEAVASLSEAAAAGPAATPQAPADSITLRDALTGYAAALQLEAGTFGECLGSAASYEAVGVHLQRGLDLGVNGTPSFFVNNKFISGAQAASVFAEVIAAEIESPPTSIDQYSPQVQSLANREPPAFAILSERPDFSGAPIEGDPGAAVVIIEFSDFQCPFCQRWYLDTLPQIRDQIGNDVALAFLHFPIQQLHPNATTAHVAAMCAGDQNKFWEMHDLLFERQDEWARLPNVN